MKTYEYTIKKFEGKGLFGGKLDLSTLEEAFNDLGRDGWELVSMIDTNEAYGSTKWVVATFKRLSE